MSYPSLGNEEEGPEVPNYLFVHPASPNHDLNDTSVSGPQTSAPLRVASRKMQPQAAEGSPPIWKITTNRAQ